MDSFARKIQEQQREHNQQTVRTVIVRKPKLAIGEVALICGLALIVAFIGAKIISNQASIYEVNKEIQLAEASVQEQVKVNEGLKVQIKELSSPDRILKKAAELGLMLNEKNVKGVQE